MNPVQQIHSLDDFAAPGGAPLIPERSSALKLSTGSEPLDRTLAGGLTRGELVEVYGQRSSGRFSIVLTALALATARGRCAALVDVSDCLDPQSAVAFGVDLQRLLWVRPRRLGQVLTSAEALAGSGLPFMVIDLGMPPIPGGRGDEQAWRRLARIAREHDVALLVSSPFRVVGAAANTVVEAFQPSVRWRRHCAGSRILGGLSSLLELRSTVGAVASEHTGPQTLRLGTSEALAKDAGEDIRILEFPIRQQDMPRYRAIA